MKSIYACQLTQISSALVAVNYISGASPVRPGKIQNRRRAQKHNSETCGQVASSAFLRGGERGDPRGEAAQHNALAYSLHDGATAAQSQREKESRLEKVTGGIQDAVQMQRMC